MSDLKEVKNGYRPIIADQEIAALFNPAGLPMSVHAAAERLNQFVAKVAELEAENAILRQFMRTCDLQAAEIAMENSHE